MNKWWRANPWCPSPPGPRPPPLRDQVTLDLGSIGSATYLRDLAGAQPRVLRGSMGVGLSAGESAPVVAEGVAANIRLGRVDVDAWERLLTQSTSAPGSAAGGAAGGARPGATAVMGPGPAPSPAMDYLPNVVALRATELSAQGRTLHNLVAGGLREGNLGVPTWTPLNSTAMWSFASPQRATWAMAACLRACRA